MDMGMAATIVIGTALAGVFLIGARRMIRNFAKGECGGCCGGCCGGSCKGCGCGGQGGEAAERGEQYHK